MQHRFSTVLSPSVRPPFYGTPVRTLYYNLCPSRTLSLFGLRHSDAFSFSAFVVSPFPSASPQPALPPLVQLYISVPRRAVSARREHLLEYAQLGRSELQIVLRNAQPNGALQFLVGRGAAGGAAEPE